MMRPATFFVSDIPVWLWAALLVCLILALAEAHRGGRRG